MRTVVFAALRSQRQAVGRLAAWSLVEALPTLLAGFVTARALDDGFLAGRAATGLAWLGVLAVAVPIGALGTRRAFALLGAIVEPFRDDLLRNVVTGALRRSTEAGGRPDTAAVSRLTHQVEIVRDSFAGLIMSVRGFVFAAAAALVGIVSLAPLVALIVAAPLLLGLGFFAAALAATLARQREYVLADERLAQASSTAIAGHRDVVACGVQDRVAAAAGVHIDAQARAERALAIMAANRSMSLAISAWLPLVVILVAAPWLIAQDVSSGAVLGAMVYIVYGLQPALHALVLGVAGGGLRFAVTLERILAAGAIPARAEGGEAAPVGTGITLRQVTFRYGRHAAPVLDRLDLDLPDGDHLAVVGPSGTGKSTLASLIAGVLAPQGGVVLLGDVAVDCLSPEALAARRVLIPQEAYVFTGTLRENLDYLRPGARVEVAVDALGLAPLVSRIGGYRATVDPATLSAGERQLIALARAYLSPARLVILDEATCHLDPATEARVEKAFVARAGTLLVVAHRISSAMRARRILLLDGSLAIVDTHVGLLARSATYRDLVGHWYGAPLDPAGVASDADRVDAAAGTRLAHDAREVVSHRAG